MPKRLGLAGVLVLQLACTRATPPARPNVLLVTIDTWRADRLSPAIAPALDRLAERGLRFTAARAAVPLTLPSHTSILTGLLPTAHGVHENGVAALGPEHPTLARLLKGAGYRTAGFVGAFVLDRRFGLSQGFDTYDDRIPRSAAASERLEAERPASAVVDSALAWLSQTAGQDSPFFVWIHLYDPHAPYAPPASFVKDPGQRSTTAMYDAEVSYADSQVARVFDALRDRTLLDRTFVVVAGDHGEGLDEHGEQTHGMLLYDSTLRVPLLIAGPAVGPGRRDEPVSLVDIAPTILAAAGLSRPAAMTGADLLAKGAVRGADDADGRDIYAETEYPRAAGWAALRALTDGRWKAIRAGTAMEIYDIRADPGETRNLAGGQGSLAAAMRSRLDRIQSSAAATDRQPVSAEAQERLRALGYVASSAQPPASELAVNPATEIRAWNAFEDALSALNERRPGALPALAGLAAGYPDAPVFQATYARALKDDGRAREAVVIYRRSVDRWPSDAWLFHDLGVAARAAAGTARGAEAASFLQEAEKAERAALALQPDSAVAHNGLGLLAVDSRRPADAVRAFERATTIDPHNASYWTNLGNARRALGDAAGAEAAFKQALDADANAADAANGLGVLLVEARRPGEAAQWFERALRAAPDLVEARLNLGIALQESGDRGRAAEAFRSVIAAPGDHPREKNAARTLLAAMGASK